jgi:hypothetical protein
MDYRTAMKLIDDGGKISRREWAGQGLWVEMDIKCRTDPQQWPYLFQRKLWLPDEGSLSAKDWYAINWHPNK